MFEWKNKELEYSKKNQIEKRWIEEKIVTTRWEVYSKFPFQTQDFLAMLKIWGKNERERKYKRKVEGKKKWIKIKNRLKVDKLLFLLLQTRFIYFNSSI